MSEAEQTGKTLKNLRPISLYSPEEIMSLSTERYEFILILLIDSLFFKRIGGGEQEISNLPLDDLLRCRGWNNFWTSLDFAATT